MVFKVGITGGIGSGKSMVCKVLEIMGYPVYYSDERAKWLMENNPVIRRELIAAFGESAFLDQTLNRSYLAQLVFSDPEKRDTINAIVHPVVRADFANWCSEQTSAIVFQESALLFEIGGYRLMDFNVLVTAPEYDRIGRVMQRDLLLEDEVKARIANQLSDEAKIPLADVVIENGHGQQILPQIEQLIQTLQKRTLST
jgi:dephospho-CoA kinase